MKTKKFVTAAIWITLSYILFLILKISKLYVPYKSCYNDSLYNLNSGRQQLYFKCNVYNLDNHCNRRSKCYVNSISMQTQFTTVLTKQANAIYIAWLIPPPYTPFPSALTPNIYYNNCCVHNFFNIFTSARKVHKFLETYRASGRVHTF